VFSVLTLSCSNNCQYKLIKPRQCEHSIKSYRNTFKLEKIHHPVNSSLEIQETDRLQSTDRKNFGGLCLSELLHHLYLLLALLEPAEVVLYEERGVELADSNVVTAWRRNHLIQQLRASSLPQLLDNCPQFLVRHFRVPYQPNVSAKSYLKPHSYRLHTSYCY